MKKQIIISGFIATIILGSTIALSMAKAKTSNSKNSTLLAMDSAVKTPSPIFSSPNETVYILTDTSGKAQTKFIGNTLYEGNEELPFGFNVQYFLDGQAIDGKTLAGKSGHVKIIYSYTSTATYNGRYIPFLGVTATALDHNKFKNLKLTNGKIIEEKSDTCIIAGYAITGTNQNLKTDFLPDSFIIEADVTDFKLNDTYTIFSNDILADLDISSLTNLDELTNSIYKLEDAISQIVSGTTELTDGLKTAVDGTKALYEGSQTLTDATNQLSDGLNLITSNNTTLIQGANTIIDSIINEIGIPGITAENYAESITGFIEELTSSLTNMAPDHPWYNTFQENLTKLTQAKGILDFATGVIAYANGVLEVATRVPELSAGMATLSAGLGTLYEGQTKLYNGSVTLKDGLTTFKTAGIDRLVNFASKDLTNFISNFRATIQAAGSYHDYGNTNAKSVRFIVKTPSI